MGAAATSAAFVLSGCMRQPTPAPAPATTQAGGAAHGNGIAAANDSTHRGPPRPPNPIKPYDQVITRDAKTRRGMFITHRVGPKLYFEIPSNELNKDMLLVGRYARAGEADPRRQQSYGGDQFAERTLRWERSGNRVILRSPSFDITADSTLPVYKAVIASNNPTILAVFDVEAYGKDSAAVIDVTSLYVTPMPEFDVQGTQLDPRRSYIESAAAYPNNVEVEATQTITAPQAGASSILAHWSMVRLPEHPMMPRLVDDRIGYFDVSQVDFGTTEYRSVTKRYIARWRLEKKDTTAALSDPVQPIVYYIDPATPNQWKPYIRAAVAEWEPAFEAAGFSHAIVAKDVPTDRDWSLEDVRHTVIRWLPSTTENAVGPHISDPRTGEILNGSIRIFHNVMNLNRAWYFTQVGPLDPRAQRWPMPDSLMGRLLQYVVAHEIGHTLGFYHNHKASSTYPTDSVRSATWVAKMGHTPSIMDYSRFNYVAQPEDHIPVNDLIPQVGVYDKYAVMWGYKPIPGARTPEQERPQLNSWLRMQDTIPWYRFGHAAETGLNGNPDPGDETEAVGDADAVKATSFGLKNIKRVMPMLIPVTIKPGEDFSDLAEIYGRLIEQWTREMVHVSNVIGGTETQLKAGGQAGVVYTPLSRDRQVAAMHFLNDNVFKTPMFFVDEQVTRRLEPNGSITRINTAQGRVLASVLSNTRAARLIEFAALAPRNAPAYSVTDMLSDLHHGVWTELGDAHVTIDAFRRGLQHLYLDQLTSRVRPPKPTSDLDRLRAVMSSGAPNDYVAAMRLDLTALQSEVARAIPRAADAATRAHLLDVKRTLDGLLSTTTYIIESTN